MRKRSKALVPNSGPALSAADRSLLARARDVLLEAEPHAQVILYGSRARGVATDESDWDLLILLDGPVDFSREDRIHRRIYRLVLDTGQSISTIVHSRDEWHSPRSQADPFHLNVEEDGIDLATMTRLLPESGDLLTEVEMAEARDQIVAEWMERARRTLTEAEALARSGLWEGCVNRLYYACFDAVRALLLARGYRFSSHGHVQSLFNEHLVHTGLVPPDLGELYNLLFRERARADYEAFVRFDEATVRPWFEATERLIEHIHGLLEANPGETTGTIA